jgi:hypothetical protein
MGRADHVVVGGEPAGEGTAGLAPTGLKELTEDWAHYRAIVS